MADSFTTTEQIQVLESYKESFDDYVSQSTAFSDGIKPGNLEIFQMNIGRWCNQACTHCHVNASPIRTEFMTKEVIDDCLDVIAQVDTIHTVDITGGAPEGNPHFRYLVDQVKELGKHVIDRCNLTILEEPGYDWLYEYLADANVEIVSSLPHFSESFTDKQRGNGVFNKSIIALKKLNQLGYGQEDNKQDKKLNLVYNPSGLFLSSSQSQLEREFKSALRTNYGIEFHNLYTINNMPINRFLSALIRRGKFESYMQLLSSGFNASTVDGLMCRNQISVGFDGNIYDCDFNQMLELGVTSERNIREFRLDSFNDRRIATKNHCFGCTAGSGSSCGGAVVE